MKSFLNVLYRRILYKIPLKLLLILLAVFGVLFACYSSAYELVSLNHLTLTTSDRWGEIQNPNNDNICIINTFSSSSANVGIYGTMNDFDSNITEITSYTMYCSTDSIIVARNNYGPSNITVFYFVNNEYTSQQCQTEYNLIPISEVDSSYCQSNNLCPSSGSPSDCPNVGVSNVFINDLFHPGAFNIVMNIPEEIDWDYAYTNSGNNMNIDIVGYNVDYEKMQEIIDIQNYKPNSEEFSTIVSSIVPLFVPGLCIILLLYFIFRFIKKVF